MSTLFCFSDVNGKIIGGSFANRGQFPYQAFISINQGARICGGSLIAEDIILTAADCVDT